MTGIQKLNPTLDVLIRARGLISDPKNWGTGKLRQWTGEGRTAYCLHGAVATAVWGENAPDFERDGDPSVKLYLKAIDALQDTLYRAGSHARPHFYNDTHTHAEVLQLLDETIARLTVPAAPPRRYPVTQPVRMYDAGVPFDDDLVEYTAYA
jgi:hypothetical protein